MATHPHLVAIITLNRSAKISVKACTEFGKATTVDQTDSGDSVLFFEEIPAAFTVGATIADWYGNGWNQGYAVYETQITDIVAPAESGSGKWEVTFSGSADGNVASGTEIRASKVVDPYFTHLDTNIVQWIDVDDEYNVKALNHHAAIGQYLTIGEWRPNGNGQYWYFDTPPFVDLKTDEWWLYFIATNRSARLRLKGWSNDNVGIANPGWDGGHYGWAYGTYNLLTNHVISINIGGEGNDDWVYNRKQLNRHRSIGQYLQAWGSSSYGPGLKALNKVAKVRVYDQDNSEKPFELWPIGTKYNVVSKARYNNHATLVFDSNHNFKVGDRVEINIDDSDFDDWYVTLTGVTDNGIVFNNSGSNLGSSAASGTVIPTATPPGTKYNGRNRKQLNQHTSIGQYIATDFRSW